MATRIEVLEKIYEPGDIVERSGIYRVSHGDDHVQPYEVTAVCGKPFPTCLICKRSRFVAERLAQLVEDHEDFRTSIVDS